MDKSEINRMVAEKVMGWKIYSEADDYVVFTGHPNRKYILISTSDLSRCMAQFNPSDNISDAWMVVEKMKKYQFVLTRREGTFNAIFEGGGKMENALSGTAPMAICLAALESVK